MNAFDLPLLFSHRDLLGSAGTERPSLHFLRAPAKQPVRVAILSGAFNPPTAAHQLIAERARAYGCDAAVFVLPREVTGKEPSGLIPEDRLLALRVTAQRTRAAVAVASHGLYVDQATAAAEAFPGAELLFLAGSDKVIQLFESHWYADRDAALEALFSRAQFLVSPRASDAARLRDVLADPSNRRFAGAITVVPLHPSVADLSSTRVRGLLEACADVTGLVTPGVATLLAELRPFARPRHAAGTIADPYRIRAGLLDALWEVREWAERAADLRALVDLATSRRPEGAQIRRALALGGPAPDELFRLQALAGA